MFGLSFDFCLCSLDSGLFMFLQNLLEIVLVVLDGSGGIFTGLIQGDLVKMLQLFIYCHYISPAYSFNPIASFTYEVIKSGLRPVPCLSGISMISGVL